MLSGVTGLELLRATVAHMAAHVCYTSSRISAEQLVRRRCFLSVLEDARIEYKAKKGIPRPEKIVAFIAGA